MYLVCSPFLKQHLENKKLVSYIFMTVNGKKMNHSFNFSRVDYVWSKRLLVVLRSKTFPNRSLNFFINKRHEKQNYIFLRNDAKTVKSYKYVQINTYIHAVTKQQCKTAIFTKNLYNQRL
jgi:hypothetical protein